MTLSILMLILIVGIAHGQQTELQRIESIWSKMILQICDNLKNNSENFTSCLEAVNFPVNVTAVFGPCSSIAGVDLTSSSQRGTYMCSDQFSNAVLECLSKNFQATVPQPLTIMSDMQNRLQFCASMSSKTN